MTESSYIRGPGDILDAYRRQEVADRYLDTRFAEPLGALLHDRQLAALRELISRERPRRILEIAPGPARLTTGISQTSDATITILDASLAMLGCAQARLHEASAHRRWRLVNGDAFSPPLESEFDLIYTFRFLRHFEASERAQLYEVILRLLRPGGSLMFDAVNRGVSASLRARSHPGEYEHFDELYSLDELREELIAAGLRVAAIQGVQYRYPLLSRIQVLVAPRSAAFARGLMELVNRSGGKPLEWIVECHRP